MLLIDQVKTILQDLAPHGWKEVFDAHGLNIEANNLEEELGRPLKNIDRTFSGFEDFSMTGRQAITGGVPADSLLFHAMASPAVIWQDSERNQKITKFPTAEQIETIENYVYAKRDKKDLKSIKEEHGNDLFITVFSCQYRTAENTPHGKYADMVYSRTGIARVGNADALYDAEKRSFEPLVEDDKFKIRVLPAKYSVYLAKKQKGSKSILGELLDENSEKVNDKGLDFYVPVHKLFNGKECLEGGAIDFELSCFHSNEKLAKIHQFIQERFELSTGVDPCKLKDTPFKFSEGIAKLATSNGTSTSDKQWITPVTHNCPFIIWVDKLPT